MTQVSPDLLKRKELFSALHRFSSQIALDLHPTWHPHFFPTRLNPTVFARPEAQPHLSRHVLNVLELRADIYDPELPDLVFAALPAPELLDLAFRLGLTRLSGQVCNLLDRDRVTHCRAVLGESAWQFALQHSRLLAGETSEMAAAPIAPQDIADRAHASGQAILWSIFRRTPDGIRERVRIKLPQAISGGTATADTLTEEAAESTAALAWRILRLSQPEWTTLFPCPPRCH